MKPSLRPLVLMLAIAATCASLSGDEIHQRSGKILYGRFQGETASGVKFLEAGKAKATTLSKPQITRIVLTYSLPDFVYTDPKWSAEMVKLRQAQVFDPAWGDVEVLRSAHYIVFTNSSAGKRYLETMEDIYAKFKAVFPFDEQKETALMPVFLLKTSDQYYETYAKLTESSLAEAKASAGFAYLDFYATYYESPQAPVHYHEGAHQLVDNRLHIAGGGSWFQEGLAVYFEGTVFAAEDPAIGMKSEARTGRYTPLPELFALASLLHSTSSSKDGTLAQRRYREAGAIIKFLAEGPMNDRFPKFLDAVRAGGSFESIFQGVYEMSVSQVEAAFVAYYKE